jgi:hypothetical protein
MRATAVVLNNHTAMVIFFFAYVSLFHASDLLDTRLGRVVTAMIGLFYAVRAIEQLTVYSTMDAIGIAILASTAIGSLIYWLALVIQDLGQTHTWGTTAADRSRPFPCDEVGADHDPNCTFYRGITIEASPDTIFGWLAQLRATHLSHGARRKTRSLQPLPELAFGQSVMDIFTLHSFERPRHFTLALKPDTGYPMSTTAVSYLIVPQGPTRCRLLFKALIRYKPGLYGAFGKQFLPWGDLIMMREQLRTIKQLAERDEREVLARAQEVQA